MIGMECYPMTAKRKFPRPPQRKWPKQKDCLWVFKRGNSTIGHGSALSNGDLIYVARRWRGEIWCGGEPSISAAIAKGKDGWALDHDHILELRLKKVKWVVVQERERGGTRYIAPLEVFLDPATHDMMNYRARGGELQHYVNMKHFHIQLGKIQF